MFDSVKTWISVPYTIKPLVKRTGTGTKQFGPDINSMCYPVGNVALVVNDVGAEVTSTTQLYVDGNEPIKITDNVVFDGEERPVLRVSAYYIDGKPDIKVVYL